jgi:hypothetical protein
VHAQRRNQPLALNLLPIADQSSRGELAKPTRHRVTFADHFACQLPQGGVSARVPLARMVEYSPEPTELQRFTSIDINRRRRAHDCGPFEFAWRGNGCTSGKSMPSGRRIGGIDGRAAKAPGRGKRAFAQRVAQRRG